MKYIIHGDQKDVRLGINGVFTCPVLFIMLTQCSIRCDLQVNFLFGMFCKLRSQRFLETPPSGGILQPVKCGAVGAKNNIRGIVGKQNDKNSHSAKNGQLL